jgi:hypothetical protein
MPSTKMYDKRVCAMVCLHGFSFIQFDPPCDNTQYDAKAEDTRESDPAVALFREGIHESDASHSPIHTHTQSAIYIPKGPLPLLRYTHTVFLKTRTERLTPPLPMVLLNLFVACTRALCTT